jgi:hypothetical protein
MAFEDAGLFELVFREAEVILDAPTLFEQQNQACA